MPLALKKSFLSVKRLKWFLPVVTVFFSLPFVANAKIISLKKNNVLYEADSLVKLPVDSVFYLFNREYGALTSGKEKNNLESALGKYLRALEPEKLSLPAALKGIDLYRDSVLNYRLYLPDLEYLTSYYYNYQQPDSIYYYGQLGMQLAKKRNDTKYTGVFYTALGSFYELKEDYTKAFENYYKGLEIAEQVKNYEGIATGLISLGFVFDLTGQQEKAKSYYKKAINVGIRHDIDWAVDNAQYNLSILDTTEENAFYRDSILLQKALDHKDSLGVAYLLNNIAVDYNNIDSIEKSYEYYSRSLRLARKLHDNQLGIVVLYNLASLFSDTTELYNEDSARKYLKEGMELVKKSGTLQDYLDFLLISSSFDETRHASDSAWIKLNEYISKDDSVKNLTGNKKMQELIIKMEYLRLQKEMIRTNSRRIHQWHIFIPALVLVGLLLLLLFYFLHNADKRRKDTENAMKYVDRLLENTNSYFLLFDESLRVLYASSGFYNDFLKEDNKSSVKLMSLVHEEDRSYFLYKIDMVRKRFINKNPFEIRVYNLEGEVRHVIGSLSRVKKPEGFVLNFWDDTKNKAFQSKVKESRRKFLRIFNSFPDIFFVLDNKAVIRQITPSVSRILGYNPEEVIGKPFALFLADSNERKVLQEDFLLSDNVRDRKVKIRKKDGSLFYGSLSGKFSFDRESAEVTGFQGVVRDLTERVKFMERLEEANATKNKLFSVIAHDLVGPMGIQKNILDLILQDRDTMALEDIVQLIRPLKPSMDATYFMIVNLMSWAGIMRKGVEAKLEKSNIYDLVKGVFDFLSIQASGKNIALKFEGDKTATAVFDKNMLEVVIRNLVSNAIKFSPEGGTVLVKIEPIEGKVRVSILDNGVGMSEETLKLLTGKRHRSFSTRGTKNEKGTGIGLIIVKEFLLKQNSRLQIASGIDNGSCFCFDLETELH